MTTATLRPNATITAADSLTGAASAHAATSDDSDSTYLTDNDTVALGFGTTTLPSGAIVKQARYRWRGRGDSWYAAATITLYNSFYGTVVQDFIYPISTSLTTRTGVYATITDPFSAGYQNIVDTLALRFEPGIGISLGLDALRVYEAYIDVVYVTQPSTSVTAVSPDPYTASTTIPIAWTNTLDSDGGAQTRYEIKVFTDAQYGAGGFDPDTSTPYYTTGEVVSAALTADVGPLENGDTYRAYVRVAQTVNGASHWSDWAYDEFTMDVTTSDVDTVTAVGQSDLGKITVTVAWDSGSTGWEYIEVQRSVDGGTTYADVRGAAYVATADSGATDFVVVDYEVPNGTTAKYRARATYLSSSLPITGAWVESSDVEWASEDCWLKAPDDPTLNMTFCLADRTPFRRQRRTGVFSVLGAAAPVAVSDVRTKRTGTLLLELLEDYEATELAAILDGSSVILVQFPDTMDIDDMYVVVVNDEETFRSRNAEVLWRFWELDYVEVDAPADPDSGR